MTKESILDELAAWKRSNDQRSDLARRAKDKKFGISLKLEDAVPLFYRLVENKCK